MEINYNLISTVDTLGFLQGVVLGAVLLFLSRGKNRSKVYLALFIIVYSLELLPSIIQELGLCPQLSMSTFTPLNFNWLLFPLFYIYVQSVSILNKKIDYFFFKIGAGALIVETVLYCLEWQGVLIPDFVLIFSLFAEFSFGIYVGIRIILHVNVHVKELNNQYATVENKELLWAKNYVLIGIVYSILILLFAFFIPYEGAYIFFSIVNVGLLYWVSLRGVFQGNIESVVTVSLEENKEVSKSNESGNAENAFISEEEMLQIIEKTENYLSSTEMFTKPDLTVRDISSAIEVHPKRLSTSLNRQLNMNFNTYINNYRVQKAAKLLLDKNYFHLSVEGVGFEVGFRSKATFYKAFRNKMETTPNQHRLKKTPK